MLLLIVLLLIARCVTVNKNMLQLIQACNTVNSTVLLLIAVLDVLELFTCFFLKCFYIVGLEHKPVVCKFSYQLLHLL